MSRRIPSAELEADLIAWDRAEAGLCSVHDAVNRYSPQHLVLAGASRTVCGSQIPWLHVSPGDSRWCGRCRAAAQRRGLVSPDGTPWAGQEPG